MPLLHHNFKTFSMTSKKIAIVGSGCSGIGALWALKNTEHEVHLFESATRLGGHTNTVAFEGPNGQTTNVDTGFIVLNTATYPNFIAFLKQINVQAVRTNMTFGISRNQGEFEWAGTSLGSVFAQTKNIFRPRMWRLIFDIIRFNKFAIDLLGELPEDHPLANREESVGEYLERQGYSQTFREDYLIPMTASVWSTSPDKSALLFPVKTLVRFFWNHHLLSTISERPDWMTIPGGSKQYIDAVMSDFPKNRVHLGQRVTSVSNKGLFTTIETDDDPQDFDHVILAVDAPEALRLLGESATDEERSVLEEFQTSRNVALLHSDPKFMPKRRVTWSAWNYLTETEFPPSRGQSVPKVSLTYWMNHLQHIPESTFGNVLVTLNPLSPPDPRLVQGIWEYHHPLYNGAAIRSQQRLPDIQNQRGISYCGAWTKYGFHEDGFSSGLAVATNHLDAKLPFNFVDSTYSRGRRPVLRKRDRGVRFIIGVMQIFIVLTGMFLAWVWAVVERRIVMFRRAEKKIQ